MRLLLIASLILAGILFAVWPIAHTISLRDLLLVLNLLFLGYIVFRVRLPHWWHRLQWPLAAFTALTLWILAVALFVSDETAWALGEIKSQWLKAALALAGGGLLALSVRHDAARARIPVLIFLAVLAAHVLYVDVVSAKGFFDCLTTPIPCEAVTRRIGGLTDGPDKSNYLTNMLLGLLLAEAFIRVTYRRRFLMLPNAVLAAVALAALFSVYAESVRNGIVELSFVLLVCAVLFGLENRRRFGRPALMLVVPLLIVVPTVFGYLSIKSDTRWGTFFETIPLALDTDANRQWINLNRKDELRLPGGESVDWSNYMRIARIKAGAELTLENPLGVGFGRNAFGHAVLKKYGENSSHSHSGLIDLAVGTGLPGTLLWLGFLGSLLVFGWRRFRDTHDYCALALLFLVTGFGVRMVLDSTIRDHMLQMFLFLAAFLAVAAAKPDAKATSPA